MNLGPIYIKKLVPGGSAILSGQLQVNDIILQVNNKNVDRMSYRVSHSKFDTLIEHLIMLQLLRNEWPYTDQFYSNYFPLFVFFIFAGSPLHSSQLSLRSQTVSSKT